MTTQFSLHWIPSRWRAMLAVVLASSSIAQVSAAANNETKTQARWFDIEIIIFSNNDPAAIDSEHWSSNISLIYPGNLAELRNPNDQTGSLTANQSGMPAYPAEPILKPASSMDDATNVAEDPSSRHLMLVPENEHILGGAAKRLKRNANYRVLFHKRWSQSLLPRNDAEYIVIQGGEMYDKHYELEGSLRIAVERYLHIDTDLWLTSFASNFGQTPSQWPVLPTPLLPSEHRVPANSQGSQESPFAIDATLTATSVTMDPALDFLSEHQKFGGELQQLLDNRFIIERTVVMRQHRRMRSQELHYIDHPLFGVLIQIQPVELIETDSEEIDPLDALKIEPATSNMQISDQPSN